MRVLVTGGAGFIGSTTAAALIDAGHDVVVVDDLSAGHRDAVPNSATFVEGDVTDAPAMDRIVGDAAPDACVHFAALIEAGTSMREAARYLAVNTGGALNVLSALARHDVGRFVLSSTAAVYGEPSTSPIDESHPTDPTTPYGESKLLVERALRWHHEAHGMRTAALRYFNAAGSTPGRPERHDPETHLIPIVLQVASGQREEVQVFGGDYPTRDGTAVRDYVHVSDLAAAHVAAVERLDTLQEITCNLGSGSGFSVLEVVDTARRVTGRDIPAVVVPRRPGDPASLVATSARAARMLDWQPTRSSLDVMISDAWRELQALQS